MLSFIKVAVVIAFHYRSRNPNKDTHVRENVVFALAVKAAVMVMGLCGIASMWMAVFADSGVAMLCVLNSIRVLYRRIDNK